MTRNFAALALMSVAMLCGCGFTQSKKDGEAVVDQHFQSVRTNGVATVMSHYSKQLAGSATKDEWKNALTTWKENLGDYQSHIETGWRVNSQVGTSAGTTVSLDYKVTYSKQTVTESFKVFKSPGDSEYRIIEHQINSMPFMNPLSKAKR